ncbi:cytochrome P450 [Frankia sp. R82]|uniref:cytochrome P450 n=1 Tax=Frankia sp. R82 TaxID=2950553 RepID=UPI0020430877|nr:cytochrome P450 [Frankia sp. R82]MCM3883211.1 cytochrome P450 [Frankia sp. R82]
MAARISSVTTGGAPPGPDGIPEATVTAEEFGDDGYSLACVRVARRLGPIYRWRISDDYAPLLVSSQELVADVCDDSRFGKDLGAGLRFAREYIGDGLFTAYTEEENWRRAHTILRPAFAVDGLRGYHAFMLRAARRLLDRWDQAAGQGGTGPTPVDVPGDLTRMTLDTIGLAGFGYDLESFTREEPHPFVRAMNGALTYSRLQVGRAPGAEDPDLTGQYRADCATMAQTVDEVIRARRAAPSTGPKDLLDLMLAAPYPQTGELLDELNVRFQVISFLIAGHETTSGLLSFALYYLMKDPETLHLAQREVDVAFGADPNPEPAFAEVRKLTYIRQVLQEALRLWPTAPSFDRRPLHDTLLAGRYPVRAGETISVVTSMLHRDAVWGDDVELFDASRFGRDQMAQRPPHSYKPFGTGQRSCIGQQFALHEAMLMLALLVHRYRLLDHGGYSLDVRQTLTLKPAGFTMTLARRRAAERERWTTGAPGQQNPGTPEQGESASRPDAVA